MRINPRSALIALAVLGLGGLVLFLPAVSAIGTLLLPSQLAPASTHVAPLLGEAIWARALGGQAAELRPLNPFSLGRMISCLVSAEREDPGPDRDAAQARCMELMPAVEAVGYLSSVHLRSQGVWQDPRVPFAQIATMTRVSEQWTKAELLDTLADRGEYAMGIRGAEAAARVFFHRSTLDLTLAQTALIAALIGQTRLDPWCFPDRAAHLRRRVLERMRDNGTIDEATLQQANVSDLGLSSPPPNHAACVEE